MARIKTATADLLALVLSLPGIASTYTQDSVVSGTSSTDDFGAALAFSFDGSLLAVGLQSGQFLVMRTDTLAEEERAHSHKVPMGRVE